MFTYIQVEFGLLTLVRQYEKIHLLTVWNGAAPLWGIVVTVRDGDTLSCTAVSVS